MKKLLLIFSLLFIISLNSYGNGFTGQQMNAIKSAKLYLSFKGFSRLGLIHQLSDSYGDKFTLEQATYGASQTSACN